MRRHIRRGCAVAAAAATMAALGVAATGAAGAATRPATRALAHAQVLAAAPGARLWLSRYNGTGKGSDQATSVAVGTRGGKVFVTGESYGGSATGSDYATVAYNAGTGARLWAKGYNGFGNGSDRATSVAVSPLGGKVFVTGRSYGESTGSDYATVAYTTWGTQLWVQRYNDPDNGGDSAAALSVARDGSRVFVTGSSYSRSADYGSNYVTVAYDAATGAQLWVSRYSGPEGEDVPHAVISPGGNRVFVTGSSRGDGEASYTTVAYNATTGAQLWIRKYNAEGYYDVATALAASPDHSKIYVTGRSFTTSSWGDYTTVAYNAATGARLWLKRYNGPGNSNDHAEAVSVAGDGSKVFVTGSSSFARDSTFDYATVAYSAGTGARLWVKRYNPRNGYDAASSVVSPGNGKVYVTGVSYGGSATGRDYATVAYSTNTGAQLWVRRYNGPGNGYDGATSLVMSPDRAKLFVTGASMGATSNLDYATIAYQG